MPTINLSEIISQHIPVIKSIQTALTERSARIAAEKTAIKEALTTKTRRSSVFHDDTFWDDRLIEMLDGSNPQFGMKQGPGDQ